MDIIELRRSDLSAPINRHPWELTRSRIAHFLLKKRIPLSGTLVDFGSGDSYLLRELELRKLGKKFYGIDNAYSAAIIQTLKDKYPGTTISLKNTIDDIDHHDLPAGCLLFMDVIEHCENDIEMLQTVIAKLADNNTDILITVPAFQSLFSVHDHLLKHFRRYNLAKLIHVCEAAGLSVSLGGYFFVSLLPIRIFQLFLERIKLSKPAKSIDNWKGGKLYSRFLAFLLWTDFKVSYFLSKIGIKLPGLSCYCICRVSQS